MVSSGKKNYKYFIDYIDGDYKMKPICVILQNTRGWVKIMTVKLNAYTF